MRINLLFAAILVFVTTPIVSAELMVAPTLEWLADHSVDSGVYRVTAVQKHPEITEGYIVKFEQQQSLRGKPNKTIEHLYYQWLKADRKRPLVKVGDEFLICFQHIGNNDRIAAQLINLSSPQTSGPNFIAVTSDFQILKDRKAIMDVFLKRLKQQPKGDPVAHGDHSKDNRVELNLSMEVYNALYSSSSCYLKIPRDLLPK